jgi:hypothetical protein
MPPDCYGYKKMALTSSRDGRLSLVYVTSEGPLDHENTVVEEVTFARYFIKALRVTAQAPGQSTQTEQSEDHISI